MTSNRANVTVLIPVRDEELHLRACLESVYAWAARVVVIDSYSTDATCQIVADFAERRVELVQHEYAGPADQKNWALDHLDISTDWILFLDADELVTPELADEIRDVTSRSDDAICGYFLNRRIIWYGRWIRFGGWFPNWNLRLFRTGRARYQMRRVHEHMLVNGATARLDAHLIHEDMRDLHHSIAKHNRYSELEALEYREILAGELDGYARLWTRDPLARRRWVKTRVWARLPGKGLLYFLWAYFVRLGFLDGWHGLRYHALHAVFKHFDEMKLWELRRYKEGARKGAVHVEPTYWTNHLERARAQERERAG